MSLELENLLHDGENVADIAGSEFSIDVLMTTLLEKVSLLNIALQASAVILSIFFGYFLAKRVRTIIRLWLYEAERRADAVMEKATGKSSLSRLRHAYWPRVR